MAPDCVMVPPVFLALHSCPLAAHGFLCFRCLNVAKSAVLTSTNKILQDFGATSDPTFIQDGLRLSESAYRMYKAWPI